MIIGMEVPAFQMMGGRYFSTAVPEIPVEYIRWILRAEIRQQFLLKE
jgi:hypothetical protein